MNDIKKTNDIEMPLVASGLGKTLAQRPLMIKSRKLVQDGLNDLKGLAFTVSGVTDTMMDLMRGAEIMLMAGILPSGTAPTPNNVVEFKTPVRKGKVINPQFTM